MARAATLARIHDAGLFAGALPNGSTRYQLRARFGDAVVELDDPYRFPPVLSDFDLYLLGEGTHQRLYDKLGAHPMTLDGVVVRYICSLVNSLYYFIVSSICIPHVYIFVFHIYEFVL